MNKSSSTIRALLIDDEQLAREELALMLRKHPEIEIVGEAENSINALQLIEALKPDLLFLDIDMPVKSGFDMLSELVNTPHVVFVTAYDSYALKAFDVHAVDYVVKPVNPLRLAQTIEKLLKQVGTSPVKSDPVPAVSLRNIFIKDGNNCFFIKLADIHYIKSDGNYCEVYFGSNKAIVHKSLNLMEERLPRDLFFRANRQEIINLDQVIDVDLLLRNVIQVTLSIGKMVELSTRQSIKFKEMTSM